MAKEKVKDLEARTSISPLGEMIIISFHKAEKKNKTESGLILMDNGEDKYHSVVDAIGNKVDLETCGFKVGDKIIFNQHDVMSFNETDPENPLKEIQKGLIKADSIWGVYA